MAGGMPVNRNFVLVMNNGDIIIDWGNGHYQDIETGKFFLSSDKLICHRIMDEELAYLKQSRRILDFDERNVYFGQLPEMPWKPIE